MKSRIRKVKKYRKFSEEFKKSIVEQYESGRSSTKELSLANNIAQGIIYKWIYKYSTFNKKGLRIVEYSNSNTNLIKTLLEENKVLKMTLGDKQIKIEYLKKLVELAGTELKVDIEKNFSTPQSNTLGKTKTK